MGGLFSKKSKTNKRGVQVSAQDRAVLDLKVQRDKLRQYQKRVVSVIAQEVIYAKQALSDGKRAKALLLLKKKKHQETLLRNTEQQMANIEEMVTTIEFKVIEADVLQGKCLFCPSDFPVYSSHVIAHMAGGFSILCRSQIRQCRS